ncbi:Protein of unknown function [Gryllus bimaculatus]|nr:Protein of unknown function [Gryllus bimaculatus]
MCFVSCTSHICLEKGFVVWFGASSTCVPRNSDGILSHSLLPHRHIRPIRLLEYMIAECKESTLNEEGVGKILIYKTASNILLTL